MKPAFFPSVAALMLILTLFSWGYHNIPDEPLPVSQTVKPNIIFIMADDLGFGDLGAYGQKTIQTPHLDKMAAEGMRFTQCYTGSTVCAPSRSVLMTGQHTGHTTVRGNMGVGGVVGLGGAAGRIPLQCQDTTIAEVLKSAGYVAGMAGKWGLGEPGTAGIPSKQGFDEFFGFLNQRRAHSYYPEYIWKDTSRVMLEGNQDGKQEEYVHDLFTDFALGFIQRHQNEPFFLYLPYTIPHDEYQIPDFGPYTDSTHWTSDEQVYAAMTTRMDKDIGDIFQLLGELAIDDNTIVFFCSDNGPAQYWQGRFDSSGGLRGRKRDLYEGGIRTPMIVRYPGKIPAGQTSDFPWYFPDVLPTVAALAGASAPVKIDGIDITREFRMSHTDWERPQRTFYWEFYENGFQQAVRWRHWKGVRLSPEKAWELYNLEEDPVESQNVAGEHPEVVAQIEEIAKREHTPSPFFPTDKENKQKPSLFIIGDSTVKNGNSSNGLWGWGDFLGDFFDTTRINVENLARGGRSSRTYITEGLWDDVLGRMKPGDYVLIQFGHNDGGPMDTGRARGSLKGTSDETREVTMEATGKKEVVHTYGWYMGKYITDTRSKGATPIVLSMIPRNKWEGSRIVRASNDYGQWAAEAAGKESARFIDLNEIVAKKYETIGKEKVGEKYFLEDHTHTTEAGARLNAISVIEGLKDLEDCPLNKFLETN
ncbi:MAG: sulfatase-like hydrolase/transferase [Phaeodactylibacter sp.]|nr:sulfatase-like hydrolase/transferase [Phaeodactylibacter sp.]